MKKGPFVEETEGHPGTPAQALRAASPAPPSLLVLPGLPPQLGASAHCSELGLARAQVALPGALGEVEGAKVFSPHPTPTGGSCVFVRLPSSAATVAPTARVSQAEPYPPNATQVHHDHQDWFNVQESLLDTRWDLHLRGLSAQTTEEGPGWARWTATDTEHGWKEVLSPVVLDEWAAQAGARPGHFHPAQRLPGTASQLLEFSVIPGSIQEGFSEGAYANWVK